MLVVGNFDIGEEQEGSAPSEAANRFILPSCEVAQVYSAIISELKCDLRIYLKLQTTLALRVSSDINILSLIFRFRLLLCR